ncbi:MAG: hypothetical protein AB7N54_12380 [Alphaproteobacteria bacterium]
MRRPGLVLALLTAALGLAVPGPAAATDPAAAGLAPISDAEFRANPHEYVNVFLSRDDWGSEALRDCEGKRDAATAPLLVNLRQAMPPMAQRGDWAALRAAAEDYVTCAVASGDDRTIAAALEARAGVEMQSGGIRRSPAGAAFANRFWLVAADIYGQTGALGPQAGVYLQLADFFHAIERSGQNACRAVAAALEAATRAKDEPVLARAREARTTYRCPGGS